MPGTSDDSLRSASGATANEFNDARIPDFSGSHARAICDKHGILPSQAARGWSRIRGLRTITEVRIRFAGIDRDSASGLTIPNLERSWSAANDLGYLSSDPDPVIAALRATLSAALNPIAPQYRAAAMTRVVVQLLCAAKGPRADAAEVAEQRSAKSWHLPDPEEAADGRAVRTLPMWTSRRHWIALVAKLADSEAGRQARQKVQGVRAEVIVAVASAMAQYADGRTGRHCTASLTRVSDDTGQSLSLVRRARRWLRRMGLMVDISLGRRLTTQESREAWRHHGRVQTAVASDVALTIPAQWSRLVPLPRRSSTRSKRSSTKMLTKRARAHVTTSKTTGTPTNEVRRPSDKGSQHRPNRPLALQRLAAGLLARTQGLDRPRDLHVGRFCDLLERHGIAPDRWTAADVAAVITADGKAAGIDWVWRPKNPLGYLHWRLGRIDWTTRTAPSSLRRVREAADAAVREEVLSSPAQTSSAEHRAQLRAQFASERLSRRRAAAQR